MLRIDLKDLHPKEKKHAFKKKGRFGRCILIFSFAAITLYTVWAMWE